MGSEPRVDPRRELINLPVLPKFKLYSTRTNFYLIGRDENKTFWRILKIDRTDPNELNLFEDPTIYTSKEIRELKRWISRGNQRYGGLKAKTTCYGIIGFVKFLGPYYMLVIKKRKKMGEIVGHTVYSIAESQMIMVPYPSKETEVADSSAEKRYKKLLSMVDLSKNFYFSYTYHLMYSLQKNICNTERGNSHDKTMFVWNTNLTQGIRRILQNTTWTIALVYGFFQQTKCSVSDEEFVLTLIARRSRHYAGTRYLRRGVNEAGSVANDVETEQIVAKEVPEGQKILIASVVQVRGSIPLFWSQETSKFIPQPDIILNKKDASYVATRHHFENLRHRYGKRIIILNLIRTGEKKGREITLGEEFVKAIRYINKSAKNENRLKGMHFDLNKHYRSGIDGAFYKLCGCVRKALGETNLFFCEAPSGVGVEEVIHDSVFNNLLLNQDEEESSPEKEALKADIIMLQDGVLRTNCIDCLDRTNLAQYAYGLVALAHQLHTLDISGPPIVDVNNPLARKLMEIYQNMGNAIALQYGGSEAHDKMFCALRGDRNMLIKQRDKLTALRRYYNNTYNDGEKQNAINVFLGHTRPRSGRLAPWAVDYDQNSGISFNPDIENPRPLIRRSFSDNLLLEGDVNVEEQVHENTQPSGEGLNSGISDTAIEFGFFETDEPASLSFFGKVHMRRLGSSQLFPGSTYVSPNPHDIPGFAHSYKTKFTPAEEMFERSSSMSSDQMFADLEEFVTFTNTNVVFDAGSSSRQHVGFTEYVLVHGYSNDFTQWVSSEEHYN